MGGSLFSAPADCGDAIDMVSLIARMRSGRGNLQDAMGTLYTCLCEIMDRAQVDTNKQVMAWDEEYAGATHAFLS